MGVMSVERARQLRKNMGAPEAKLWNALRELRLLGHHFRRQVPLGRYYADFCCHKARLVIEVDGDTHFPTKVEGTMRSEMRLSKVRAIKSFGLPIRT